MPNAVSLHLGAPGIVGPASWVESLRQALPGNDALELAIASPCPFPFAPFTAGGVKYYGLPASEARTRISRVASRWRDSVILPDMNEACEEVASDFNPNVIHVHGTENPFGLIGPRIRTPVVISLQGLMTVCERFFFHGMTTREIAGLVLRKDFALGLGDIQGYWHSVAMAAREREIMRSNRFFLGRTEWDRAVLEAINPTATYFHCDEVLRPPFYSAVWQREAAAARTVFCTSSALLWKGAECLIEAVALLQRAGYADLRLRIAGVPPGTTVSRLYTARARKHGVTDSIDWLGRVDAEGLVAELLDAAVFAYPSHIDNSPNALCEALLVGVPTVASYVGGIPSLIDDGRDGLLYPDGDPYALAGRIRRLLDEPSTAAGMGRRARERALRRHDPDSIVDSLVRIYTTLIA